MTTFIIYVQGTPTEEITTKIDMNRAIDIVTRHYPITGFDAIYDVEKVVSINIAENIIELACIVI